MVGSPLPAIGITHRRVVSQHHLRGYYPSFVAPTGSCALPLSSPCFRLSPDTGRLCRVRRAPAGRRWFPTLSPRVFPWMLAPLSRWHPRCTCPLLPAHHRPSPRSKDGSAHHHTPCSDFRTAGYFGRVIGDSLSFRPPGLLATQVAPTAGALVASRAAVACTCEQNPCCYLHGHRIC